MKNLLLVALIAVVAISFTACGSQKMGGQVKGETFISEGWVTPDIFRVTATGAPKPGLKK